MKRLLLTLLLAGCGGSSPQPGDAPELPLDDATVRPPPTLEPARATIRVHYPHLDGLAVRGEGSLSKAVPCEAGADATVCTVTVTAFPAGRRTLRFQPLRDGQPARGAPFELDRDEVRDVYPHFIATQGQLILASDRFHSQLLDADEPGNTRRIWAWLPASYDENTTARYPVVYMHDGSNLFDAATSLTGIEWQVDEVTTEAWEHSGAFDEFIVIGIDQFVTLGDGSRQNRRQGEYNPTDDQVSLALPPLGKTYARMIATELKPQVDAALRTRPEAADTAIMGSSLGASVSFWAVSAHPQQFGRLGGLSPAGVIDNASIAAALLQAPPRLERLYLDTGTAEGTANLDVFVPAFRALGYVEGDGFELFYETGGEHTETAWARRLPRAFAALFPSRRSW